MPAEEDAVRSFASCCFDADYERLYSSHQAAREAILHLLSSCRADIRVAFVVLPLLFRFFLWRISLPVQALSNLTQPDVFSLRVHQGI